MEDIEGYGGEKELIAKFGLEIRDEATFIVSRRRWLETVSVDNNLIINTRPNEGDLIYFPRIKKLFEINFVDHDDPFHQLDSNPIYKMHCRLFEYSSEQLDTGITAIDAIEDAISTDTLGYQFTLEQSSAVNEDFRLEWGHSADAGLILEETDGDNIVGENDSSSVGTNILMESYFELK